MFAGLFYVRAQNPNDVEGCKDHPFFSRMPNFYITNCSQNFNKLEYYISDENVNAKEGELTVIPIRFRMMSHLKFPASYKFLEIMRMQLLNWEGKRSMLVINI